MIVVKAGGGEGLDMEVVVADVAEIVKQGQRVVLVHGGSHETNVISEKLGHPPRFVTSISGHSRPSHWNPRRSVRPCLSKITPSCSSKLHCTAASRCRPRVLTAPPALITRCQGTSLPSGSALSAHPTVLAARRSLTMAAIWP